MEVRNNIIMFILSSAAEDDAGLVKHIGQSFRFSAIEVGVLLSISYRVSM